MNSLPWLKTYTGKRYIYGGKNVYDVRDIAHALSHTCRFAGHPKSHYSTAQHSLLVAALLPDELKPAGLLHDAAEVYTGDIMSPVRLLMGPYDGFNIAEERIEREIAAQFGIEWPWGPLVKRADRIVLATEARDIMGGQVGGDWNIGVDPLTIKIVPLNAVEAEKAFLRACEKWLKK